MVMNYSDKTIGLWLKKMGANIKAASNTTVTPYFGTGNDKTHAINEGTTPIFNCPYEAQEEGGCAHSCYAFRMYMSRPVLAHHYDENTVLRRKDAFKYYEQAFAAAYAAGALLRLNESGDFENVDQFKAACKAAKKYKTVVCITYTHRQDVAIAAKKAPANIHIHYSAWTSCDNMKWASKHKIPFACATKTPTASAGLVVCPAQARQQENSKRAANGLDPLPAWNCAACAASGIGCASKKNVAFRLH